MPRRSPSCGLCWPLRLRPEPTKAGSARRTVHPGRHSDALHGSVWLAKRPATCRAIARQVCADATDQIGVASRLVRAYFCNGEGRVMVRLSHSNWRRLLGCVLAYALVLQAFIFALDVGQSAIAAAQDPVWAGFELCSHSAGGSTRPDAPAHVPTGDAHCIFCIVGGVYVNCAPPGAPQFVKVMLSNAAWPHATPRLVALVVIESAWPRGPPASA